MTIEKPQGYARVQLKGVLAADPDFRTLAETDELIGTFAVGVRTGNEVDYHRCILSNVISEVDYPMYKGVQVIVNGHLKNRAYESSDGSKRFITEIIVDVLQIIK
jgi:single-strand DNA-binding protein